MLNYPIKNVKCKIEINTFFGMKNIIILMQ